MTAELDCEIPCIYSYLYIIYFYGEARPVPASAQCQNPGGWCAKVGCHKIHDDVEAEEGSLVVLIRSKLIECPSRNGTKCITWMAPSHAADLIKVMDCFFFRLCP